MFLHAMSQPGNSSRCALLISFMIGFCLPRLTSAQDDPIRLPSRFRESVTLPTDGIVIKKLATVDDYLADGQWAQAINVLRNLSRDHRQTLVPIRVERNITSPTLAERYISSTTYCNLLLSSLPPEALALYRQQVDAQAKRWFDDGVRRRDAELLTRILQQAFVSSHGDDALSKLGEWAWERGDYSTARKYWTMLAPPAKRPANVPDNQNPDKEAGEKILSPHEMLPVLRYPDTNIKPELVLARLVLCSIAEGNFWRARLELDACQQQFDQIEGTLAGREGNLVEILEQEFANVRKWKPVGSSANWNSFASGMRRNGSAPADISLNRPLWSVALSPERLPVPNPRPALGSHSWPRHFPVICNNRLFVNDANTILAFDLATGEPAWPIELPATEEESNEPEISRLDSERRETAIIYPSPWSPALKNPLPERPIVGVPRYTMTISGGRLFARMGSPVSGRARNELRALRSEIVCLDLDRGEGTLLWKLAAGDVQQADAQQNEEAWSFEGSPVVRGEQAYVVMRKMTPQIQINVVCLNASDGRVIWNQQACAIVGQTSDNENLVDHLLLALADDRLFLSTNRGAVCALATSDGTLEWVITYESQPPKTILERSDPKLNGLLSPLVHGDQVFVAPTDSSFLFALQAETGRLLWQRKLEDRLEHLIGVRQRELIVSGRSLWSLDYYNGNMIWKYVVRETELAGYGRGMMTPTQTWWPQREAIEVFHFDQSTNRLFKQRHELRSQFGFVRGGNLLVSDGYLVITQEDRITVFGPGKPANSPPPNILTSQKENTTRP